MTPSFDQLLLDTHDELIVDLFAGGGGASLGIELATGRQVDHAVNHDGDAVALHEANHPTTTHHHSDVFEVDPRAVTGGRPVGLLWASPDCTFFSKARGAKPIRHREKKRRGLAWVVTRWAGQVRPRRIILENVEEFTDWGPLVAARDRRTGRVVKSDGSVAAPGERVPVGEQKLVPCPARAAQRFRAWRRSLERLGYQVEWRELRASDYGAPTIRKRLFVIARCDGEPIVWPKPTHGKGKKLKPVRTAAECIDWSEPMCSIFATAEEAREWGRQHRKHPPRRPLADATMRRIARGVVRFVLEAAEPFIVSLAHGDSGGRREYPLDEPLGTQHSGGNKFALVTPAIAPNNTNNAPHGVDEPLPTVTGGGRHMLLAASLAQTGYGEREGQAPRALDLEAPLGTIVGGGQKHALVGAFLARHWGGMTGKDLREPHPTILTKGAQDQVVAATLAKLRGTSSAADAGDPLHTVSAQGNHHSLVYAFLQKYYGEGIGSALDEPTPTITTKDRMGLVTVQVAGEPFVIVDIAMRMLQPRELYTAQGFPRSYIIDRGYDGRQLTKTAQVRMVGNSVPPPMAAILAQANAPDLIARDSVTRWVA